MIMIIIEFAQKKPDMVTEHYCDLNKDKIIRFMLICAC